MRGMLSGGLCPYMGDGAILAAVSSLTSKFSFVDISKTTADKAYLFYHYVECSGYYKSGKYEVYM